MADSALDTEASDDEFSPKVAWVREKIADRTSAEVDGDQNGNAAVWTGEQQLKARASKTEGIERDDIPGAVGVLLDAGAVIRWHGLLAPLTNDHLNTIIENERKSGAPRQILIAKCSRLRRTHLEDTR